MNNIHKVIFNKNTQQFVVVSELAKSAGKPKAVSADSVDIVSLLQNFSEKQPLVDSPLSTSGQILVKNCKEAAQKRNEAESWQTSGENKRKVDAVTTAITLATVGKPTEAIAVGAASPYVNQAIKEITKESETANIATHVLWGAIEAELSGNKAQTGAIAAATAELGAKALTQAVYNKTPTELTAEEKATVLEISKAMAGIAVGATDGGNAASVVTSVATASEVAKNAVENNALLPNHVMRMHTELEKAAKDGTSSEEIYKKYLKISEAEREDLANNCVKDPGCRWAGVSLLEESNQDALGFTGVLNSFFSNLSNEQQTQFLEFVIDENTKSLGILESQRSVIEKLTTQWVDEYIASRTEGLGKKLSPKISGFAKKAKNNKGSAIPYPEPQSVTLGNQKVIYKSNSKHTKGMPGNRANAGIEPRNSLELFKNSVEYKVDRNKTIRYAKDSDGNIHRFFGTNGEYHWSGSSNDKSNPLPIPSDLKF